MSGPGKCERGAEDAKNDLGTFRETFLWKGNNRDGSPTDLTLERRRPAVQIGYRSDQGQA